VYTCSMIGISLVRFFSSDEFAYYSMNWHQSSDEIIFLTLHAMQTTIEVFRLLNMPYLRSSHVLYTYSMVAILLACSSMEETHEDGSGIDIS
jgi:hypothetical protein